MHAEERPSAVQTRYTDARDVRRRMFLWSEQLKQGRSTVVSIDALRCLIEAVSQLACELESLKKVWPSEQQREPIDGSAQGNRGG